MLKISHYESSTKLLGPYNRFVIWVHGCCFDCEGCLAHNTKFGEYTELKINELCEMILASDTEGITISGGEPFMQAEELSLLIKKLREKRNIGVIVYSGFTHEELELKTKYADLLNEIDILIDGRYVRELDDGRAYVGSSNQRIIYLTERYKEIGVKYYSAKQRRAEIKFTKDKVMLIGVPSANALRVWNDIKLKSSNKSE